jgi:hypothetical protein
MDVEADGLVVVANHEADETDRGHASMMDPPAGRRPQAQAASRKSQVASRRPQAADRKPQAADRGPRPAAR